MSTTVHKMIAAEALEVLYLVDVVVENAKGAEEGKITTHVDCHNVLELLT